MRELFDYVYRLLRSKLLGVLVILAMAVLALFGTLISQAPSGALTDPEAYAQWLETVRPRYGGWTPVLDFLGFFHLWTSPLFLGTTILLALSIIACTVHRIPALWERATRPRTHVSPRFFEHAQYRAEMVLPLGVADTTAHVGKVLRGQSYRLLPDGQTGAPDAALYADRFRWGPFGTAIAHAAMVVVLAAFGVSAFTGFEANLDIAVGQTVLVGHGTDLSVTAASFSDTYDDEGRPLDYVSHLVVRRGDTVVGEQDVRVNSPLVVDGVAFHQASFGIAAAVTVTDAAGTPLFSGAVPLKWTSNDGRYAIGKVTPEGSGIEVLVVTPASGASDASIPAGSAVFELYDVATDAKLDVLPVEQGEKATSNGLVLTFERELRYTGIIARQDPGAMWMWVGSALLVIGMCMTFMLRHRRLWVRVTPEGDGGARLQIASAERLDTTFERHFRNLVARIDATAPDNTAPDNTAPDETKKELTDA